MALQGSGAISLANLATEFGGAQPHSLSEYYRNGGLVPNAAQNNAIATAGAISLGSFYGAVNRVPVTVDITTDQTNYVFNTAKVTGYIAGITDVIFNVASGVVLSSNNTGVFGADVDLSWAAGDTVRINLNGGFFAGMGGAGGQGGRANVVGAVAGAAGGPAFRAQRSIKLYNGGTIGGGGGGGGGGGSYAVSDKSGGATVCGGGGGGGRTGRTNSAGGPQQGTAGLGIVVGTAGAVGTFSTPGVGGSASTENAGGGGGGWGSAGGTGVLTSAGNAGNTPAAAGGAAGAAIVGNANISYIDAAGNPSGVFGTRLGAIT